MSGDIISKASDIIWQRDSLKLIGDDDDDGDGEVPYDPQQENEVNSQALTQHTNVNYLSFFPYFYSPQYNLQVMEGDDVGGFLKLSQTLDWVTGEDIAPVNKKDRDKVEHLRLLPVFHISNLPNT